VALAAPAFANDLPTRAAQTPAATQAFAAVPPPVFNWTGFYIGGNVGYGWGSARSEFDFLGATAFNGDGGPVTVGRSSNSDKANLNGAIGGFQAGYNWQSSPNWLWGLETDLQWSGAKGRGNSSDSASGILFGSGGHYPNSYDINSNTDYTAKITWFGTARGRVGYAMDRFVIFGTGGFAYGNVKVEGSNTVTVKQKGGFDMSVDFPTVTSMSGFSQSKVNGGWTAGFGIEGVAWDPRWTWKIEYLYLDLGTLRVSEGPPVKVSTKFTDNIVRFGLNFHY
jgi:outer membrane immunogenic protein